MPYKPGSRALLMQRGQNALGEADGTPDGDSFFSWIDCLNEEADELATKFFCVYGAFQMAVTAGKADYCAPQMFWISHVYFTDANNQKTELLQTSKDAAVYNYGAGYYPFGWTVPAPPTGTPTLFLSAGTDSVTLYPTPDTSLTWTPPTGVDPSVYVGGGLTVEGYYTPTPIYDATQQKTIDYWKADPDDPQMLDPYTLSAICPLPARHWNTVWRGAALRRIAEFPVSPDMAARIPVIRDEYQRGRGKLEREVATWTADRR